MEWEENKEDEVALGASGNTVSDVSQQQEKAPVGLHRKRTLATVWHSAKEFYS